ncbi:MAG: GDSL-type esterase/lipase family protein [Pseudomonadota bacterium]
MILKIKSPMNPLRRMLLVLIPVLVMAGCGSSENSDSSSAAAARDGLVGAWSAAPYGPYPLGPLTMETPIGTTPGSITVARFDNDQARDQSFRMIINPTISGTQARIRLSNLKGDRPVRFESVSLSQVLPQLPVLSGERVSLTFGGKSFVIAQPGEEVISDVVDFALKAQQDLAVSFHVAGESGPMTWHALSFGPQYISAPGSGDVTDDIIGLSFTGVSLGWFFISGLDVVNTQSPGALVAIGDSITDGAYQVLNQRWTDRLATRLNSAGQHIGILNQGINSNTVTELPQEEPFRGSPAVLRFDRDVLQRSGVKGVIIFEGTNDLGAGVKAEPVIAGLQDMIRRARSAGLCVFMATITPRADVAFGWFPDGPTVKEPERIKINTWIREQAPVDGVIDFDAVLALPGLPAIPNIALYFPDLLHPNPVGFRQMGDAIDIDALRSKCGL